MTGILNSDIKLESSAVIMELKANENHFDFFNNSTGRFDLQAFIDTMFEMPNEIIEDSQKYAESLYCTIFWNLDDLFSYLGSVSIISLKYVLSCYEDIFSYNILSFFYNYYWYEKILSGSPKSNAKDILESSVLNDLVSFTRTLKAQFYVSLDIAPVNGFLFPYLLEHPEVCASIAKFENFYFFEELSVLTTSYLNSRLYYVVDTCAVIFSDLSLLFILWFYLKVFFFSFVFNAYSDGSNNDTDHTVSTLITESEKEIAGIDDLMIIFLVLFFVFGIYFLFYGFAQLSIYFNNYAIIYLIFPILFFFIYVAPVCVLFDFGIYLFVYLRGSGPTAMLAAELLYDIINTFAYFIRVFIQLARILLMLIAAGSLQEFIFYIGLDYRFLIMNESFIDTIYNIEFNSRSLSLFFFTKFPLFILYWIYEIFHTYFVVTIQTIAFFAMVFWLYFYLFTFFLVKVTKIILKLGVFFINVCIIIYKN